MHTPKVVHYLRRKPIHVRERILIVTMAVITPALITVWFSTFHFASFDSTSTTMDSVKALTSNITNGNTDLKSQITLPVFPSGFGGSANALSSSSAPSSVTPSNVQLDQTNSSNAGGDTSSNTDQTQDSTNTQ